MRLIFELKKIYGDLVLEIDDWIWRLEESIRNGVEFLLINLLVYQLNWMKPVTVKAE